MKVEIEIPDKFIAYALCAAYEGGSRYWALTGEFTHTALSYEMAKAWHNGAFGRSMAGYYAPLTGGSIEIREKEYPSRFFIVDGPAVTRGLQLMAKSNPYQFGKLLHDSGDATTGDVLMQFCALGEEKYG